MAKGEKTSFIMQYDYKETFEALGADQAYQLLMAMFAYEETQTEPEFTGMLKIAWIPIRQDLDKNRANWEKTSEERAKAGSQGGRGNKKEESKKSNSFMEKQSEAKKAKKANKADSECDCDCDSECDDERENTTTSPAGALNPGEHVVKTYTGYFGKPSEKQAGELFELTGDRGYIAVWNAVCMAGQREPPPGEPMAYIRKVLENTGTPEIVFRRTGTE